MNSSISQSFKKICISNFSRSDPSFYFFQTKLWQRFNLPQQSVWVCLTFRHLFNTVECREKWMQEHVRCDWGIGHDHCKCTQCMSGCLNAVHITQQAVNWQCRLIFREKETLPQSFTRKNTDSGQLFTFNFSLKRWRKERERLWLKKFGRGLRWTNISVNVKSAGFILKQPSIFIVICAAHFIMLVLDLARWECRAVLD